MNYSYAVDANHSDRFLAIRLLRLNWYGIVRIPLRRFLVRIGVACEVDSRNRNVFLRGINRLRYSRTSKVSINWSTFN